MVNEENFHNYKIEPIFLKMRDFAFNIKTAELKILKEKSNQIYGVFMETGYKDAVFSLRCFAEGSISIYFTNGGGIIGIGEHEKARKAGLDFIKEAEKYLEKSILTTNYELPDLNKTIFYILTFDGIYYYETFENDLGNMKSDFSPLFYKAQEVITEARIIDEERKSANFI